MNSGNTESNNNGTSYTDNTFFINSNNTPQNLVDDKSNQTKSVHIHGLTGIVNTTNTCYMNSAIQAFSHNYPLTGYLFNKKEEIFEILKKNARKILKDNDSFKLESKTSTVPTELREKIQNPDYSPKMLSLDETNIVFNHTITAQLIRLLENMWARNCVVIPTSFRKVFCEARDKFFYGYEQHDAEEAYSCVLQKMQEELAEDKNVKFKTTKASVQDFLQFKNDITMKIKSVSTMEEKKSLLDSYMQKKKEMAAESLIIEAFREMKKYYGSTYSRVTEIFSGFMHSSTICPEPTCGYSSNRFEVFLHLSLPMPPNESTDPFTIDGRLRAMSNTTEPVTIENCMHEFCKEEILDEKNLWLCEGCNQKVRGIKKIQLWTAPPVLVIQLKRFNNARTQKDGRFVSYPMEHFDISSMISPVQSDTIKCNKYKLICVINHSGQLNNGHYYTYCLDADTDKWFEFNDINVNEISPSVVKTSTAYLLFYIREDFINQ